MKQNHGNHDVERVYMIVKKMLPFCTQKTLYKQGFRCFNKCIKNFTDCNPEIVLGSVQSLISNKFGMLKKQNIIIFWEEIWTISKSKKRPIFISVIFIIYSLSL